jgi:hypothetical protein
MAIFNSYVKLPGGKSHVPNHQAEIFIQAAHPIGQGQKHLPQKHLLGHLLGEPRSWMLSSPKKRDLT